MNCQDTCAIYQEHTDNLFLIARNEPFHTYQLDQIQILSPRFMTNTLMAELEHLRAQVAVLTAAQQGAGPSTHQQESSAPGSTTTQAPFIPVAKAPPQLPNVTRMQSHAPPWAVHPTQVHVPEGRPSSEPIISADEFQTVLLALTPDEHPPNLQRHLFRNAKEALLILSTSPRLTTVQQQELRDIVRILNSMCP